MKLLTFGTPWARIAVTFERPVDEVQRRWEFLRKGIPSSEYEGLRSSKRVSFADPLVTGDDVGAPLYLWPHVY